MQIVTLDTIKLVFNITDTSQDARLTYLANLAEGSVLDYCYLPDMDAFYAVFGEEEPARAALVQAVLYVTDQWFHGNMVAVTTDPHVMRTLLKYRPPEVSGGSTE